MLTTDDVKRFHRLGYYVTPVLFDAQQIEQIRDAIDRVYANDLDDGRSWPFIAPVIGDAPYGVRIALFSAHVNRTLRAAVGHEDLVRMAAALLGCDAVRLWQDQAIWKPGTGRVAVDDGNIGFHQDYAYWQDSSTTNMVSANVALQDVTSETGALRVFPESHKLGLMGDYGGFFNTDLNALRKRLQADYGLGEDVPLELKAGQATFHHSLAVHGSGPNTGPSPRLVLAPAYIPDGTFFREEGQPGCPHSNFLGDDRHHGTPFAGEHFPLMRWKPRR